jgi:penicillin-binding protein 2
MEKLISPIRLAAMVIALALLIVIYVVALYKLQIVEGARYYEESINSKVTEETVSAARGSILDRYGRVLVTNRTCNNLVINVQELLYDRSDEEANAIILEMCSFMDEFGDTYTDELPITKQTPFEYTDMTDIQRERLSAWKQANKLDENASAVEVMAAMRTRYKIDNSYTGEQARIIAGVRYEVNVRYLIQTSDYIFAEDVSMELIASLMEQDIPGFDVKTSYVREYNTAYAAHVLGYTGMMSDAEYQKYSKLGYEYNARVGKDGAEYAFEEYLHGKDGRARVTSTATGVVTSTVYTQAPEPGDNIYLTLDIGIQEAAENALGSFITAQNTQREAENAELEKYGGAEDDMHQLITGGAVAVVDIATGEPLALASWPSYDAPTVLENYSEILQADNDPLFNRALQGTYAPGSTFKPVTAIAGLSEHKIDLGTTIKCEGIFTKYADAGYTPTCWIYGKGLHGELNVSQALTVSCNYFFYTVADYLQITLLAKYAQMFGLGESTGIELYEDKGIMATDQYMQEHEGRDMYAGDTLAAGIGQSVSRFNSLQLAEFCAAIANNGTRRSASILKSVRSFDYSETIYEHESEVLSTVDVPQEYFDAVHAGMRGVVNDPISGSVYQVFADAPYTLAAKTGTAETGEKTETNGVFMCYAPYDDPKVAVVVAIEKAGSGSSTAPVARQVLDYYFSFADSTIALESEGSLLK